MKTFRVHFIFNILGSNSAYNKCGCVIVFILVSNTPGQTQREQNLVETLADFLVCSVFSFNHLVRLSAINYTFNADFPLKKNS